MLVLTWLTPDAAHFSKGCTCVKYNTPLSIDFTHSGRVKLTIKRKVVDHFLCKVPQAAIAADLSVQWVRHHLRDRQGAGYRVTLPLNSAVRALNRLKLPGLPSHNYLPLIGKQNIPFDDCVWGSELTFRTKWQCCLSCCAQETRTWSLSVFVQNICLISCHYYQYNCHDNFSYRSQRKWRLDAFARGNDFDLWTAGSSDQIVSWFSKPCPPVTVPENNTTGLLALFSKSTQAFLV